jgi:hypothetical protein
MKVLDSSVMLLFLHDIDGKGYLVYDFNGKMSMGMKTKVRELMIALKNLDILEKAFLYSTNVNNGKMRKDAPIIEAKDVLTFGFGFDALGDQHVRRALPPDVAGAIREKQGSMLIRLFNNEDYGYYKTSDLSLLESIYPKSETKISFENFHGSEERIKSSQILFNSERIGIETLKYQDLIVEKATSTSRYFSSKRYVREKDIKDLENFRRNIDI